MSEEHAGSMAELSTLKDAEIASMSILQSQFANAVVACPSLSHHNTVFSSQTLAARGNNCTPVALSARLLIAPPRIAWKNELGAHLANYDHPT